jgi:hypothetical protein
MKGKEMNAHMREIDALMAEIGKLLEQAGAADLSSTTLILRMARLDLLTLINDIDADELKAFSESLKPCVRPHEPAPQAVRIASHKPPPLNH